MEIEGFRIVLDSVTKFHRSLYVWGWWDHPERKLAAAALRVEGLVEQVSAVGMDHGGVLAELGPGRGFQVQALREREAFDWDAVLILTWDDGQVTAVRIEDLLKERITAEQERISSVFRNSLHDPTVKRILDVGGRNRSRIDRRREFPDQEVIVFDILPGENVDVVGDAHDLSRHFPPGHFDAIFSVSVFEHLLMPWRVVLEINEILKTGGIAGIHSHQSIGVHDAPWDFWRFSDTAWDALFNRYTGFEILDREMRQTQYLIPNLFRHGKEDAEKSAGFEGSSVLVRKIGPPRVSWPVPAREIQPGMYPDTVDETAAADVYDPDAGRGAAPNDAAVMSGRSPRRGWRLPGWLSGPGSRSPEG